MLGAERSPATEAETEANLIAPIAMYPLFESVLWAREGTTLDEHRPGSAACGPGSPRSRPRTPTRGRRSSAQREEIATPSPENRLVTLPYPKLLNSNIQTDQSAALILCSDAAARELGLDRERLVHPHAAGHAYDHWFVSEREDLHSSPAIRFAAARRARRGGRRHRRRRPSGRLLVLPQRRADRLPRARASTRSRTRGR